MDVYFEEQGIHSVDPGAEFYITIYGSIAQSESENISANVKWGKAQSAREGKVSFHYKKADFANESPLSDFSPELFNRTVSELLLCENGSVILTLTNGQRIGKEKNDGSDSSAAAEKSSSQNTADR